MRPSFSIFVRIALSTIAVLAGVVGISLTVQVISSLRESRDRSQNPDPILVGQPAAESQGGPRVNPLWPKHPQSPEQRLHTSMLNGVQMISEEWAGSVAPHEVMDFYREQMVARGWSDCTEESLGLGTETLASVKDPRILQDPSFLKKYDEVINGNLILRRGNWSIHVLVKGGGNNPRLTSVRVVGVSAADVARFAIDTLENLAPGTSGQGHGSVVEHEQVLGENRHRTTLSVRSERADRAYRTALVEMEGRGWRTVFRQEDPGQPSRLAWLVHGKQQATLSVAPIPDGRGSRLTLTEISPK